MYALGYEFPREGHLPKIGNQVVTLSLNSTVYGFERSVVYIVQEVAISNGNIKVNFNRAYWLDATFDYGDYRPANRLSYGNYMFKSKDVNNIEDYMEMLNDEKRE